MKGIFCDSTVLFQHMCGRYTVINLKQCQIILKICVFVNFSWQVTRVSVVKLLTVGGNYESQKFTQ